MSPREMKKRRRLTPSLASGKVFEEAKRQKEMATAAEAIDRLRASAEPTVAGREPNLNLRLLVLEDDGFVPRQVTLVLVVCAKFSSFEDAGAMRL
jgi:hypothetical protein